MRRIFLRLAVVALAAGVYGCNADAPSPTSPRVTPTGGPSALQVRLFTTNANPVAGFCTQIQAIVTLNGGNVPDGTGVSFSTDFGVYQQSGLPVVSVVTQNGTALTALCSTSVGVSKVKASATVGANTGSATLNVSFQPSAQAVPFFSFCSPNFGTNAGGTTLTLNGGRFFGDETTTRVQFTALSITREAIVQAVTATSVKVLTPAFPEAISPSVPVDIAITFGTNTASPIVVAAPNCFVYGTASGDTPTITAVLPSTGTNDGGTRVTIIGSGFQAPMQVFFDGPVSVEAPPPISITYNQINVVSPPATGAGVLNLNALVTIRVRNTTSGKEATLAGAFRYVTKIQIISLSNNTQDLNALSPVTIFGQGFSAPVAVSLAGVPATPMSVSATEIVAMPSVPLLSGCGNLSGGVTVTNISSGDSADSPSGLGFTYVVPKVVIGGVSPNTLPSTGGSMSISGSGFPATFRTADVTVSLSGTPATVTGVSSGLISVVVPSFAVTAPACGGKPAGTILPAATKDVSVTNLITGCTATATGALTLTAPCQ